MGKRRVLAALLLAGVVGMGAGCSGGSGDPDDTASESESKPGTAPSPADSHTFEGTGTKVKSFSKDDDKVVLSGDYEVRWEIKENKSQSSGGDGPFEASLFCEVDPELEELEQIEIVRDTVTEGDGLAEISIPDPQECQVNIVSSETGKWTVEVARK